MPRFSLRFLFHLMTAVAVFASLFIFTLRLPENVQDCVFILMVISGFLFFGAAASSVWLHPIGSVLMRLILAVGLITQAFSRYYDIRELNKSFVSWKGFVFTSLLIGALILFWQSIMQFRRARPTIQITQQPNNPTTLRTNEPNEPMNPMNPTTQQSMNQ